MAVTASTTPGGMSTLEGVVGEDVILVPILGGRFRSTQAHQVWRCLASQDFQRFEPIDMGMERPSLPDPG